ncbi:site-specific integrase [Mesonia aestuariivivens]|uniref:Site-specific integrase n=1 Tax=Mesonia aestuariivivens TaxID=2796128 RepID=A0ABS6W382_9FLAO|nr:site-specific integrase [Mesonia aestuariivivens]MBW2961961.1 site-specific integrase [Mesonia aestuariivivens]
MQLSFHLRKDKINKDGLIPIRLLISFNSEKIFRSVSGVKVLEKQWNKKNERITNPRKGEPYNNYIEFNKILDNKEAEIKKLFRYILLNEINPTKDFIIDKLKNGLEKINLSHKFFPSFEEFININRSTKSPRTIKSYRTTLNFLKHFETEKGIVLTFESIDHSFFEDLKEYTFSIRKNKNSYLAFIVKVLKTFMNWAHDKEYHTNLKYKKFKAREDETEVIYLTMDELMTLFNYNFESKRLTHVRDTYCMGCFSGLRFSDLALLKPSNIFDTHINLTIQKTRSIDHKIPLNKFSMQILEKYKGTIYEPLPIISGQKFNKYLKECCKIVGIDTPITITRYIGQKRVDKTLPKYKLITSHTARKSFVTNSLVLGMKEMVVRNLTGHKKEESFRKYVKIAENFKQQEMDNTWNKL